MAIILGLRLGPLENSRGLAIINFTSECLGEISQRIIPQVQQLYDYDPGFIKPPGSEYLFPLFLEIVIDVPSDEENQVMERAVIEDSLQHFRMNPASKNAINSLKKFKIMKQNEHFTICMEEFDVSGDNDDDVTASAMPCNHVFHQQCIVKWLQTSHVCPLCRYSMATANEH
ncbi:RING-H2 finger protein ATL29-like [Gastrolobium bilobum]|uniref:RING-H2 finger protein ATL29-like n=1 Tax=Gastrolobium bilobum TaxID=150636 RepID=UPI002AAF3437|nr:RING-H2 finger protein ATL29-like [Gastrolobium bilobum]